MFVEVEISVLEGKVMTTGSEERSSADISLRWKKVMYRQWVHVSHGCR